MMKSEKRRQIPNKKLVRSRTTRSQPKVEDATHMRKISERNLAIESKFEDCVKRC